MEHQSQGFVEVTSYVGAIEAADAMVKSANVSIKMAHKVDGPDICVICEGDVAACKAAVSAGEAISLAKGVLISTNVIPRPEEGAGQLYKLMDEMRARKAVKKAEREARREAAFAKMADEETPNVTTKPAQKTARKSDPKR